jgi:anti-sigma factor RsiW
MTAGGCADARICLGAYVLGALEPAERGRVDAHLAECDSCRDELASFAALPGLLSRATIADVELVPDGPRPELLQRLLTAVAAERRRGRRARWLSAVAAGVIVVSAGTVAGVAVTSTHDATPAAAATFTGTNPEHNVTASVAEWPRAWGAALEVHVTGAVSGSYVDKCQLVAVAADGTKDVAGSWTVTPSGKITAQGATSMTPAQIAWFEIVRGDGEMLVKIPVHPGARSDT